jgi:4-amino-4-deoxy-L-arabinose transferase-like glycosyltransferase
VGNVPGSLSTMVVGVPLVLWDSPWSPMLVIITCNIMALFLFDKVVKQVFDEPARLLFLVLFWLSPWFLYQHMLYNLAYLFFCSALHFYTAFHLREKSSFWLTFGHVVSVGLVMQLHYSWPLLVMVSGYLFVRGVIKINYWGVLAGFLVLAATLVPYALEVLSTNSEAVSPEEFSKQRYIGWGFVHVYPVVKALLYWVRYSSFLFTEKLINGATFDWITSSELLRLSVMYAYRCLLYGVGLWTLFYSFRANWYLFKRVKGFWWHRLGHKNLDNEQWLLLYIAASAVAILISAGLSPTVFGYWHLIMLYPFAAMNMLVYLTHHKVEPKNFWRYLILIGVFSIFVNIVAAHDSVKFTYKVPYAEQVEVWLIQEKL